MTSGAPERQATVTPPRRYQLALVDNRFILIIHNHPSLRDLLPPEIELSRLQLCLMV